MPNNAARLKAYDFAAEAAKQELSLSAAIIAVAATFLKDIFKKPPLPAAVAL